MSSFWIIAVGVGGVWFITSGRAAAILAALTGEPATITPGASTQYTPNPQPYPAGGLAPPMGLGTTADKQPGQQF